MQKIQQNNNYSNDQENLNPLEYFIGTFDQLQSLLFPNFNISQVDDNNQKEKQNENFEKRQVSLNINIEDESKNVFSMFQDSLEDRSDPSSQVTNISAISQQCKQRLNEIFPKFIKAKQIILSYIQKLEQRQDINFKSQKQFKQNQSVSNIDEHQESLIKKEKYVNTKKLLESLINYQKKAEESQLKNTQYQFQQERTVIQIDAEDLTQIYDHYSSLMKALPSIGNQRFEKVFNYLDEEQKIILSKEKYQVRKNFDTYLKQLKESTFMVDETVGTAKLDGSIEMFDKYRERKPFGDFRSFPEMSLDQDTYNRFQIYLQNTKLPNSNNYMLFPLFERVDELQRILCKIKLYRKKSQQEKANQAVFSCIYFMKEVFINDLRLIIQCLRLSKLYIQLIYRLQERIEVIDGKM